MCVSFDYLMNVYGGCLLCQGCGGFDDSMFIRNVYMNYKLLYCFEFFIVIVFFCDKCGFLQYVYIDSYSVFQIVSDGSKSWLLILDYLNLIFIFFDEYFEYFVFFDGKKIIIYKFFI